MNEIIIYYDARSKKNIKLCHCHNFTIEEHPSVQERLVKFRIGKIQRINVDRIPAFETCSTEQGCKSTGRQVAVATSLVTVAINTCES